MRCDAEFQACSPPAPAREPRGGQRLLDITLTLPLLVILAPMMVLIALIVWLSHGRAFNCWKFRSMDVDSDRVLADILVRSPQARAEWDRDHKLKVDPRITRFGRILRSTSLDELPQLWNVLCGEMSLVGPRPIVVAEAGRYGARFHDYCSCRPGITGLWQVSGRSNVSYRRRVAIDTLYARRCSVSLDFIILARTVPAVLLRRGSY